MPNENEKIKIALPIIVEGKYDKITLLSVFDAAVMTTEGFSVFNSKEKQALLRKLCERGGVILLLDSDAGGRQIRTFLSRLLPKERIYNLYIPELFGKEKRKRTASRSGMLGVEGMTREVLMRVLSPFFADPCQEFSHFAGGRELTKLDLYNDGLSGGEGSAEKRAALARALGLPHGMSAKALIEAINLLYGYEKYKEALAHIF